MSFSIDAMFLLALILWQALGFPEVEDPLPEKIGIDSIVGSAGAGGVLAVVLSVVVRKQRREWLISLGTFAGFCFGVALYCLSLLAQLIFSL